MVASNPNGTCYEDAWRFQIKQEEGILVHGSVTGADGVTRKHAWVELPTGFIYEPQTARFFKADVFKRAFNPKEDARYTVEEAAKQAARTNNLGPWSAQERELLTRRSNVATANLTKEEDIAKEIARYLVAKRQPIIKAAELDSIFKELGYGEKEITDFTSYVESQEGEDFFRKSIRVELYKAGYRPKGESYE